jgi:tetratricopeptide (TPR) repeat protein
VPKGNFTDAQLLILYFAGNAVQILIGILAFSGAIFASAPYLVTLLVYLSIWAVGGTVILYALMSATGLYGDWAAIYLSPAHALLVPIAITHALLVIAVLYGLYGTWPKIWLTGKTQPKWLELHKRYLAEVSLNPTPGNWLNLAISYQKAGLLKQSHQCLQKALLSKPDLQTKARVLLSEGSLFLRKGNADKAANCYRQIADNEEMPLEDRLRAYCILGDLQERQNNLEAALSIYNQAIKAAPSLADAHYLKARLLLKLKNKQEATDELKLCSELPFFDPNIMAAYNDDALTGQ